MLSKRLTESRLAVSLFDPSIAGHANPASVGRYARTRDLADLGDLSELPEQPLIFHVSPVLSAHEHLIDAKAWRVLFQLYVTSVDNLPAGWELARELGHGSRELLTEECADEFPKNTVDEIGKFAGDMASINGTESFFELPDGWMEYATSIRFQRAAIARARVTV